MPAPLPPLATAETRLPGQRGPHAPALPTAVLDPARLAAVRATGLLDSAEAHSWDSLTSLAARLLHAPMAFMTLVDDERAFWLSCSGIPAGGPRQNTVRESFCQYVVADRAPLFVDDATTHARTRENPSVALLGVQAWAGYPVLDAAGRALGSFCVVDTETRTWSYEETEVLRVLAEAASAQVRLMTAVNAERRAEARLQHLASVALELAAAETIDDLVEIVINRGLPVLGADGGAVLLREEDGSFRLGISDRLGDRTRVAYGLRPADDPLPACEVARTGRRLQLPTRASGVAFAPEMAAVYETTHRSAWVFSPLRTGSRVIGSLSVSWVDERSFPEEELDLVDAFAAQCAQVLERIRADDRQRDVALQVRQLAETLQQAMLTSPVADDSLSIAVRYTPASHQAQVGGDWYDAFQQPDGDTMLVIGDVVGHDAAAAARMGQLRGLLRALAYDAGTVGEAAVLTRVEHAARGLAVEALASAVLVRVEPRGCAAGRPVRWSNAGHLPPVLLLADGTSTVLDTEPDLLLGVDPATPRTEHRAVLPPGATLLLFTDGLVERRGSSLDEGLTRLRQALTGLAAAPLEQLCDAVLARLAPGAVDDDIAVLAVRDEPAPTSPSMSPSMSLAPEPDAVGVARRFVEAACRAGGTPADLADTAVLLTSELVTNAFVHGHSRARITVQADADLVHIDVADSSPVVPDVPGHDLYALGGRGMALVEALATRWGVRERPDGKDVWVELAAGRLGQVREVREVRAASAGSASSPGR